MSDLYYYSSNIYLKIFKLIGVHPEGKLFGTILFTFNIFGVCTIFSLVILLFIRVEIDLAEAIEALETVFLLLHGSGRAMNLFWQRKEIGAIIREMQQFWKLEEFQGLDIGRQCEGTLRFTNKVVRVFITVILISLIFFLFRPFIIHQNVLAFNCYIPQNVPYFVQLILQNHIFIFLSLTSLTYSIFMCSMFIVIQVQFKFLNYRLSTLNMENDGARSQKQLEMDLEKNLNYHNFLIGFVHRLNNAVSVALLINFSVMTFAICLGMYKLSTIKSMGELMRSLTYVLSLATDIMIFLCLPAQFLTDEAERVSESIYFSKWYTNKSPAVQKAVMMMIMRGHKTVHITAGNILNINLETCMNTFKSVISYFMCLQTVGAAQNEEK